MKVVFTLLLIGALSAHAADLYVTQEEQADACVVYRTSDHTVVFGEAASDTRILSDQADGLENFALVTVRNENGISQSTELGEVVYRDGRTLILRLHRPLTGDFVRPDVFNVRPLRPTAAPAVPIPIPLREGFDDTVADIVAAVNEDTLISITTNYENYVTRYSNADGYDTACEWSNDKFISWGLDSEVRHFSMLGYDCQNVIATQTGTVHPDQYWIICGHLDSTSPVASTNAPGADDNGSGSACVMEAARIMSQYDFEYTVRYCLWGGEEQGLYGSAHYADSVAAVNDQILGVVNLDMIFYGPVPDDQAELHYNTASQGLGLAFSSISDTYVPALGKTIANPPVSASDHSSFWNAGYPAMLSIEKEVWNNPYYHQTTDVMANYLQYFPFGTNMAKAAIATVAYLAVPVNTGIEQETEPVNTRVMGISIGENPVSAAASVTLTLPAAAPVSLTVHDMTGRTVLQQVHVLPAGNSMLNLDTSGMMPGLYLVRADNTTSAVTERMVLIR